MRPLILDYAVDRKQEGQVIFSYDNTLNLNVVRTGEKANPYVDADTAGLELTTVTKVKNEGNDVSYNMLELLTKTDVVRERDDQKQSECLELITKTSVERERDKTTPIVRYGTRIF